MTIDNNRFRRGEMGMMAVRATVRIRAIAAESQVDTVGTADQLGAATVVNDPGGPKVPLEETAEAEDLATIQVRGVNVGTVVRGMRFFIGARDGFSFVHETG